MSDSRNNPGPGPDIPSRADIPSGTEIAKAAGFTLMEVLVALAIMALALVPLLQIYSRAAGNANTADNYARASAVAESALASVAGGNSLHPGEVTGKSAEEFDWVVTVRPFSVEDAGDPPVELFELEAVVTWSTGPWSRSLTLRTLRAALVNPT